MNELINYEHLFICIVVSIISFTLGFCYQLSRLYKMKTGKSIWRINFKGMEKELLKVNK